MTSHEHSSQHWHSHSGNMCLDSSRRWPYVVETSSTLPEQGLDQKDQISDTSRGVGCGVKGICGKHHNP